MLVRVRVDVWVTVVYEVDASLRLEFVVGSVVPFPCLPTLCNAYSFRRPLGLGDRLEAEARENRPRRFKYRARSARLKDAPAPAGHRPPHPSASTIPPWRG